MSVAGAQLWTTGRCWAIGERLLLAAAVAVELRGSAGLLLASACSSLAGYQARQSAQSGTTQLVWR